MNKTMKQLLVALLAISSTGCFAAATTVDTNRSTLNLMLPRDGVAHESMLSGFTCGHHDKDMDKDADEHVTVKMVVSGFYNQTRSEAEMAKYLGLNNSGTILFQGSTNGGNSITNAGSVALGSMLRNKVRNFRSDVSANTGTITNDVDTIVAGAYNSLGQNIPGLADRSLTLNPRSRMGGAHGDVFVDFNSVIAGLSFRAGSAVAFRTNNLRETFSTEAADTVSPSTLQEYLQGTTRADSQLPLAYAKIPGRSVSTTRATEVDLQLKYRLVKKEKYSFAAHADMLVPTGNEPTGEFLFEPIVSAQGFRAGAGLGFNYRFFKSDNGKNKATFKADVKWQYGFANDQWRVLDVNNVAWGKYLLMVKKGNTGVVKAARDYPTPGVGDNYQGNHDYAYVGQEFIPGANVLRQKVSVEQRNIVEARAMFNFKQRNFDFEAGYQFSFKQEEKNSLKTAWVDGSYLFILPAYNPLIAEGASAGTVVQNNATNSLAINAADLVMNHGQQMWHTAFASVGYSRNDVMFSLGGSYNFSSKEEQRTPRSWDVFGKIGMNF